ncbi:GAF domain-containing protein [Kumtagia ephedrae]|uniref:GAF domain-containing protein n=1 Tax=Kumtagia ephedrae TaxID=2116701 RepID=A0A2P7SB96_9HYPH|nr:GAF domain-containing protein [Mesorhizobium ephedrae]PSJ59595.1 GAF domain-containing protein [Mesorhizobium ephedrae]
MQVPDYSAFTKAVAAAGATPETAFAALWALTRDVVGVKLFTVMTHDGRSGMAQRIYSNMPDAYPVSGTKPANETDWSRQVIGEKRTFVANDIDGIAAVFSDHELIRSLGCESVINVPIIVAGEVKGTINCLHEAGFYTPERVEAAEALKLPGALCLLLNELSAKGD